MKIILLGRYNPSEKLTGPDKFAKRIYHTLLNQEVDCEFIEYFFDGKKFSVIKKMFGNEKINYSGIHVLRLGIFSLFIHLVKINPNLIHLVTYERFQVVAFLYAFLTRVKIFFSLHGLVDYENLTVRKVSLGLRIKDKLIEKIFLSSADKIHVGVEGFKKTLSKKYNLDKSKIVVIPFGVDDIIRSKKDHVKQTNSRLNLVFVGDSLRVEKGLDFLLSLYKELIDMFKVFIIGEDFNCDKKFYYDFSFVKKMPYEQYSKFLEDKDIILSCSYYDTFNIAVLEAVANGLYPVVSRETGVSELLQEEGIGDVYNYEDKETLLKLLSGLYWNRDLISRFDYKSFAEKYCWNKIAEKFIIHYSSFI